MSLVIYQHTGFLTRESLFQKQKNPLNKHKLFIAMQHLFLFRDFIFHYFLLFFFIIFFLPDILILERTTLNNSLKNVLGLEAVSRCVHPTIEL